MVYAIKLYGHALSRKRDELSSTTQVFLLVGFKLLEGWIPQKQLSTGGRKLRLY